MNTPPATRSRWLDWQPTERIFADNPDSEATKPTKPGFDGFDGSTQATSPKVEACRTLNRTGVRIIALESATLIGVWSDLDGPEIRAALHALDLDEYPAHYLDGTSVPVGYKLRRVKGEPVSLAVLFEMERSPAEPWKVRDRMLSEMRWRPKGANESGRN
jgi:hypothetical protein